MESLIRHLVGPLVSNPDAIQLRRVEGEAVTRYELIVHEDDRERLGDHGGKTLRSIQSVVSAASGHVKSVLECVDAFGEDAEE